MYILAMETTGPHCSVALIDENGNVTEKSSGGTLNHLQNLIPMIKALLDDCKLQIDDMTAIAVSAGPGSFTGIRIGVSTARALCQAAGKPAIAVPTLKSFVYHMCADCASSGVCALGGSDVNCSSGKARIKIAAPIFDARRNQVYGGAYVMRAVNCAMGGAGEQCASENCASGGGEIIEVVRGGAYMLDEFLELLAAALVSDCNSEFLGGCNSQDGFSDICASADCGLENCSAVDCGLENCASADCGLAQAEVVFYGDGCEKYSETALEFCRAHGINASICGETQKASSVARLALDMYKAGELLEYGQLHPDYMRKAEAERKLEEKRRMEVQQR